MRTVAQYGIADVVKVRHLNAVKQHNVLELHGIPDNAVLSDNCVAADKGAVTHLSAAVDYARAL